MCRLWWAQVRFVLLLWRWRGWGMFPRSCCMSCIPVRTLGLVNIVHIAWSCVADTDRVTVALSWRGVWNTGREGITLRSSDVSVRNRRAMRHHSVNVVSPSNVGCQVVASNDIASQNHVMWHQLTCRRGVTWHHAAQISVLSRNMLMRQLNAT